MTRAGTLPQRSDDQDRVIINRGAGYHIRQFPEPGRILCILRHSYSVFMVTGPNKPDDAGFSPGLISETQVLV